MTVITTRLSLAAGLCVVTLAAGSGQSSPDEGVLAKIRTEALEHSQVSPVFDALTVDIGPRLTASPAHKRAAEWVRDRLVSYGLQNVHLEPWKFGRGWTLERLTVDLVEPRYVPLTGYADGWSAATPGDIVAAPVFLGGKTPEDIEAMREKLRGAIVMTQPILTNFVRKDRPQPSDPNYTPGAAAYATAGGRGGAADAQRIAQTLRDSGAGVILKPSIGEHGTVFVTGRDGGPGAVPTVTLAAEHYNMIARLLERHVAVKLRVGVQSTFYDADDGNSYNVIGELAGADPAVRDEVSCSARTSTRGTPASGRPTTRTGRRR